MFVLHLVLGNQTFPFSLFSDIQLLGFLENSQEVQSGVVEGF